MRFVVRRLLAGLALGGLLAACSSGDATTSSSESTTQSTSSSFVPSTLEWDACDGAEPESAVVCATLDVPYDYEDPSKGSFTLLVKKRPADDPSTRVGSLLVNPGGPGFGGSSLADDA